MKHLFLTGERGAGKTMLLSRLLPSGVLSCGFVTERTERALRPGVYLHMPGSNRRYMRDNRVGSWENGIMYPHPEVFETLGVSLLSDLPPGRPIIMDELGVLEQDAPRFCARVLELLDGACPVIGVVKNRESLFLDTIRSHPNVEMIWVNEHNRQELCTRLRKRYEKIRTV